MASVSASLTTTCRARYNGPGIHCVRLRSWRLNIKSVTGIIAKRKRPRLVRVMGRP